VLPVIAPEPVAMAEAEPKPRRRLLKRFRGSERKVRG
jgi:hypothetical protein